MSDPGQHPPRKYSLWRSIIAIVLVSAAIVSVLVAIVASHAEPILRARVIETLSARFKSKVELDGFHVSALEGLQVSGNGLRLFGAEDPNNDEPGIQPLISVAEFRFRTGVMDLLRSPMHVNTVYVKGLILNLPPREQRGELKNMEPQGRKIQITVDKFVCDQAQLIINTLRPGKLPLEFDIEKLNMTSIGPNLPLQFDANLTNPKPVGNIISSGSFGPWQADSPRDTPVRGTYSFTNADLSTIKGIGGILSSTGQYSGTLSDIVVHGTTDTPDFRIARSGHPVALHTEFHAKVDGTSGDTYLKPVIASFLHSGVTARGSVVRMSTPPGHDVELDVVLDHAKIEDLLELGVRTDPPIMDGPVQMTAKLSLPPGKADVSDRLRLAGDFHVLQAHFSNQKVQRKLDSLS